MPASRADTRPACELHTHKLWVAKSNANGHSYCDSDSNSYADFNTDREAYTDAQTAADSAPASVSVSRKKLLHGDS